MAYSTNIGPESGPICWRDDFGGASGVLGSRDDHTPIGMVLDCGWGEGGVHLWRLVVHGVDGPGRWIVVGRESWPAEGAPIDTRGNIGGGAAGPGPIRG
jgi:hypothetical protein